MTYKIGIRSHKQFNIDWILWTLLALNTTVILYLAFKYKIIWV